VGVRENKCKNFAGKICCNVRQWKWKNNDEMVLQMIGISNMKYVYLSVDAFIH
jgi:hypothetical protein